MLVGIRNETGFDLYLAIEASTKSIRVRVSLDPPPVPEGVGIERLRTGHGFALQDCPEGIRVHVRGASISLRVSPHREVIDHLDEDHEVDGQETFLLFTLRLAN